MPNISHMLKVAAFASIKPSVAKIIIDEVRSAIASWPTFADEAGLSALRRSELDRLLNSR
ncbi:hypothetical protein RMR21_022010 [Agrobacterium sp. rho-8.1]|nr:hypothetical protein [Agrobacterium sp. rho-8.1]